MCVAAFFLALTTAGCWASKEETASQLQKHMKAYENLRITPGNASSVIKSTRLLLSKDENNNFRNALSLQQGETLGAAKSEATYVVNCVKIVDAAKVIESSGGWKPEKPESTTSSGWDLRIRSLENTASCDKRVQRFSKAQQERLSKLINESKRSREIAVAKEIQAQRAAEAEKKRKEEQEARKYEQAKALCRLWLRAVFNLKPGIGYLDASAVVQDTLSDKGYPQLSNEDRRDCRIDVMGE